MSKLHSAAVSVAADLIKYHSDHLVLKALKACGAEGNIEAIAEHSYKLSEQKDQLIEVSLNYVEKAKILLIWDTSLKLLFFL